MLLEKQSVSTKKKIAIADYMAHILLTEPLAIIF